MSRKALPYWGGQAVWKDILATLAQDRPSRGTPFQSDAEIIVRAVQTKYLAGELSRRQGSARRCRQPDRLGDRAADRAVKRPARTIRASGRLPPGSSPARQFERNQSRQVSPLPRRRLRPCRSNAKGGNDAQRNRTAYGFLAPYLLVFAAFWVWPIINSFLISFQATRTVPWRFAPTFNWGRLISDPAFYNALKNTLLILVIQVPIMIALATVMAVLLNSPLLKAKGLFRFAFFAPVVVGEVAYSAVFRLMFNFDFGIINKLLNGVGLPSIDWFSNVTPAMALIIIAVTWRWAGYNAIIILAGLQSIPEDVYEAATLDRVSKVRQFFYITLPLLEADHRLLRRAVDHRHDAALHRAVPDHRARRPGQRHRDARPAALPPGLHARSISATPRRSPTRWPALAIAISLLQLWLAREPK